jgi:hypothetical protein
MPPLPTVLPPNDTFCIKLESEEKQASDLIKKVLTDAL